MPYITEIYAMEVLDSRGIPTVEVEIYTESMATSRIQAPSDYSNKYYQELRDKENKRYNGFGVSKAVDEIKAINDRVDSLTKQKGAKASE